MRNAAMSARIFSVSSAPTVEPTVARPVEEQQEAAPRVEVRRPAFGWNQERFAHEQIRGLVRQIFSPNINPAIRQVVFSAVDFSTEIRGVCRQVGETLARETFADVAIVVGETFFDDSERPLTPAVPYRETRRMTPLRQAATRVRHNLWMVPITDGGEESMSTASLQKRLSDIRREFDYSIVVGSATEASDDAMAMAQFADGIILVLSAERTRRITARKIRQAIDAAQIRLLGTVLSDREFPVPAGIYRRL
jgi:hypothetical protein